MKINFLRILDVQSVHSNFIARHAKSRTYLYRLGLLDKGDYYWNELNSLRKIQSALDKKNSYKINHMFPFESYVGLFDRDFITEIRFNFKNVIL